MTALITELGYLGLEVSDLERWKLFATDVLGMTVEEGPAPKTLRIRMDSHNHRYVLVEGPADDVAFVGWRAANAGKMIAFIENLKALGIEYAEATKHELNVRAVDRMVHFTDPNGLRHEVYFGPLLASERFISPRVQSGFVTGECGMGHVVFPAQNYRETVDFVSKVFGFELTDQIRLGPDGASIEITFMHLNPRHHSLAFAQAPGPTPKRLHHFMVEVGSVEDVGRARDRCLDMGLDLGMDIGQHPNDNMISFYGHTPSGFLVEYGCEGKQIDVDRWQVGHYKKISEWGHRPLRAPTANKKAPGVNKTDNTEKNGVPVAITGKWNIVIRTPMGDSEVTLDLTARGDKLTGLMMGPQESSPITNGTVTGNALTWSSKVTQPMPMDVEFTATIDGSNISGNAKSPFGSAPFSGNRV